MVHSWHVESSIAWPHQVIKPTRGYALQIHLRNLECAPVGGFNDKMIRFLSEMIRIYLFHFIHINYRHYYHSLIRIRHLYEWKWYRCYKYSYVYNTLLVRGLAEEGHVRGRVRDRKIFMLCFSKMRPKDPFFSFSPTFTGDYRLQIVFDRCISPLE